MNAQISVQELLLHFRAIVLDIQEEHIQLTKRITNTNNLPSITSSTTGSESSASKPPSYRQVVPNQTTRRTLVTSSQRSRSASTEPSETRDIIIPPKPPIRIKRRSTTIAYSPRLSSVSMQRGALIVLEGLDRVGKSTLADKLIKQLGRHHNVIYMRFPNRSTSIGKLINDQLVNPNSKSIDNRSMHLLFSANRWEQDVYIREAILGGTTVVVDRYSYSGIAYSCAQQNLPMSWCCQIENGLPKPDIVIFLELPREAQYKRPGFGDERYETVEYQESVREQYEKLIQVSKEKWLRVDVENKGPDQVLAEVILPVQDCVKRAAREPLSSIHFGAN